MRGGGKPKGEPGDVRVYDFPIKGLGRVTPYGVYDLAANAGWVSVGLDHDTAAFAVATLRHWWEERGQQRYRSAQRLLITADGGGSNGWRLRLWKLALQTFADEIGLPVSVCHFPPGLVGFLLAVIICAALSATAAALSSLGTTSVVDFWKLARPEATDAQQPSDGA